MKKVLFTAILLVVLGSLSWGAEIEFADSYESALKLAAEKDQNVLVTFYTDW